MQGTGYGGLVLRSRSSLATSAQVHCGQLSILPLSKDIAVDRQGGWRSKHCPAASLLNILSPTKEPYHFLSTLGAVYRRRYSKGVASSFAMADTLRHLHEPESLSYLSQKDAAAIDEMLMGSMGFSVDQLMELAGLSVASAIAQVYGVEDHPRVLVIAGPGNNGGDGLVAARHLHHFGYKPSACYPKPTDKPLYNGLVTQLKSLSIPLLSEAELPGDLADDFDIVVDAMFGFSFKGKPRPPFDTLLERLIVPRGPKAVDLQLPAIVSIDIPSGWHVEEGDIEGTGLLPDMLVSLTAPKLCVKNFNGAHHFLGGRFVPPEVVRMFGLRLPPYPGTSQCVRIGRPPSIDVAALRENYIGLKLVEEQAKTDPMKQFQEWFEDAVAANLHEPNAMTLATANAKGLPSARMVLLKGYDERGFVWYTNYGSRKGAELAENPHASLVFFWDRLHRSVRVEGSVERVSEEESEQYFKSRPRESQIGALVSAQSSVIEGRTSLDQCYEDLLRKFPEGNILLWALWGVDARNMATQSECSPSSPALSVPVPKPDFWGGFRLHPARIEFWQGRPSRLHDRLRYTLVHGNENKPFWLTERLSP